MAQINDLLVLGNSNLLGSVNILGDLIQKGEKVVTISALSNISYNDLLDLPTSLKNPNLLIFTGASTETYDGSTEVSINIVGWAGTGAAAEVFNSTSNKALGQYSHAEGFNTTAGTAANGLAAHSEGVGTVASGNYSHAQGYGTMATANHTSAQGYNTVAAAHAAFATGEATHAGGKRSIAGGLNTFTVGENSIALGQGTANTTTVQMKAESNSNQLLLNSVPKQIKVGSVIECEGIYAFITSINTSAKKVTISAGATTSFIANPPFTNTTTYKTANIYNGVVAGGNNSFSMGSNTLALGVNSFAIGAASCANDAGSYAEGSGTIASGTNNHVQGKFNIENTGINAFTNPHGTYAHIVGNGTATDARSNAHTLAWDGTAWFQGDVYTGSSSGTNKDSGSIRLARINELPGAASASAAGIVKIGSNISVSSGTISVPAASDTVAGVTIVYPAAKCTSYTTDSGTVSPAAVKQAVNMFGITKAAGGTFDSGASTQKDQAQLKWATVNSKTPFIGYATDQTDGTFVIGSITGTAYQTGLAIGGGSGNLLWKGVKVATTSDIPSTHAASKITAGTFAGQVVAKSDAQTPGTSLLRNSKLVSTSTSPTVNGEICWQYE